MLDDENHLVTQFLTLWAMLDPISHLPLFLAATVDFSGQEKRRAAVLGVVFAFLILIFFGVAGELLLAAMGISLMSFQISGGIILLVFSISMVLGDQPTAAKSPLDREGDAQYRHLPRGNPDHCWSWLNTGDHPPDRQQPVYRIGASHHARRSSSRPVLVAPHLSNERHDQQAHWSRRYECHPAHHGHNHCGDLSEPDRQRPGAVAAFAADLGR